MSLQANRIENTDARKAFEDSQLRVQAMGMIHRKLYGENVVEIDMNAFIPELAECIIPFFGFTDGSIQRNIDTNVTLMNVDKAVPLGLILNELLTNSCKYAFPHNPNPELRINLTQNSNHIYTFSYTDNGPGFDYEMAKSKGSFGLRLIELQSRQLFGQYSWNNQNGTNYSLQWKNIQ